MQVKEIPVVVIDNKPAKRCSDFDEDCKSVKRPSVCWEGITIPMADGYCPLMFKTKTN